ncbi:MAG TPA: nitroreductase family protein [Acidimicrobiia bacterium]|jgi:nitroreductase
MDFYEAVRVRRMVRNYAEAPVDPAAIERIVDAARRSPSAGHSQGFCFVVVTDEATRHRIAEIADEPEYVAAGFDPWISRAPVHIVIGTSEEVYRSRYREPDKSEDGSDMDWPVPYWWVDAGGAMLAVLLAAVAEGLAAGFLGSHTMSELEALLGIPDDVALIGIVTIGHPATDRRSGSLARGWRPGVVHHERWGS